MDESAFRPRKSLRLGICWLRWKLWGRESVAIVLKGGEVLPRLIRKETKLSLERVNGGYEVIDSGRPYVSACNTRVYIKTENRTDEGPWVVCWVPLYMSNRRRAELLKLKPEVPFKSNMEDTRNYLEVIAEP